MKNVIRKITTWLLVFGMTFTPVLTSIDAVAANASEEEVTIVVSEPVQAVVDAADDLAVAEGRQEQEETVTGAVPDVDEAAQDVHDAVTDLINDKEVNPLPFGYTAQQDDALKTLVGIADTNVDLIVDEADNLANADKEKQAQAAKAQSQLSAADDVADDYEETVDQATVSIASLNSKIVNASTIDEATSAFNQVSELKAGVDKAYKDSQDKFDAISEEFSQAVSDYRQARKDYKDAVDNGLEDTGNAKDAMEWAWRVAKNIEQKANDLQKEADRNYRNDVFAINMQVLAAASALDKSTDDYKDAVFWSGLANKGEEQAKKNWEDAEADLTAAEKALKDAKDDRDEKQAAVDAAKLKVADKKSAYETAKEKAEQAEKTKNEKQSAYNSANDLYELAVNTQADLKTQIDTQKTVVVAAQEAVNLAKEAKDSAKEEVDRLTGEVNDLDSEINGKDGLKAQIADLESQIEELNGTIATLEGEIESDAQALEQARKDKQDLENQLGDETKGKIKEYNAKVAELGDENSGLTKELEDAKTKLEDLDEKLESEYKPAYQAALQNLKDAQVIKAVYKVEQAEITAYNRAWNKQSQTVKNADMNLAKQLITYQLYKDKVIDVQLNDDDTVTGIGLSFSVDNGVITATYTVDGEEVTRKFSYKTEDKNNYNGKAKSAHWLIIDAIIETPIYEEQDIPTGEIYYTNGYGQEVTLPRYIDGVNYKLGDPDEDGKRDVYKKEWNPWTYKYEWKKANTYYNTYYYEKERTEKSQVQVGVNTSTSEYFKETTFFDIEDKDTVNATNNKNEAYGKIYDKDGVAWMDKLPDMVDPDKEGSLAYQVNKLQGEVNDLYAEIYGETGLQAQITTLQTEIETLEGSTKPSDLAAKKAELGDENSGLIKQYNDKVAELGDENSGKIKDLADLQAQLEDAEGLLSTNTTDLTNKRNTLSTQQGVLAALVSEKWFMDWIGVPTARGIKAGAEWDYSRALSAYNKAQSEANSAYQDWQNAETELSNARTARNTANFWIDWWYQPQYDRALASRNFYKDKYDTAKKQADAWKKRVEETYQDKEQKAANLDAVTAQAIIDYKKVTAEYNLASNEFKALKNAAIAAQTSLKNAKAKAVVVEQKLKALKNSDESWDQIDALIAEWELQLESARQEVEEKKKEADLLEEALKKAEENLENTINRIIEDHERRVAEEGGEGGGTPAGYIAPVAGAGEIVLIPLTGGTGVAGVRTGRTTAEAEESTSIPAVTNSTTPATTLEEEALPAAAEATTNLEDNELPAAQGATEAGMNLWWLWAAIAVLVALGFGVYKYVDNNKKKANTK